MLSILEGKICLILLYFCNNNNKKSYLSFAKILVTTQNVRIFRRIIIFEVF